jgi:hypothetical protein
LTISGDHVGDPDTVIVETSSTVGGNSIGDGSKGVQVVRTLPDVVDISGLAVGDLVKIKTSDSLLMSIGNTG